MIHSMLRTALFASVGLASASATVTTATEALAAPVTRTVSLKHLDEQFVPQEHMGGDREFDGHGPMITAEVKLSVTADGRSILANIYMHAKETQADWSETRGSWVKEVYRVETGKKIVSIVDTASSTVTFKSSPAGFQLLAPTQDFVSVLRDLQKVNNALMMFAAPGAPQPHTAAEQQMKLISDKVLAKTGFLNTQGNKVHLRAPATGPVRLFAIVGDTGGPDISTDNDPKDDTRIVGIKMKQIKIRVE
jgi:hypothetical protein